MYKVKRTRSKARPRRLGFVMLALFSAVFVLLGACNADDDDGAASFAPTEGSLGEEAADSSAPEPATTSSDEASPMRESGDAGDDMTMEETAEAPTSGDGSLAVPTALSPADLGREIIYRATIDVQADDVEAASREAVAIVEGLGGFVSSQSTRTEPRPRTQISFKVLPANFSTALERLAGVGRLVDQVITSDDVTETIVDLESRITTAEASVNRLRKFLEEAEQLEDVAQLERELMSRETTLERLRGQFRTLRGQVDLATITITITQSPTVLPDTGIRVTAWVSEDAQDPCLGVQNITVEPEVDVYLCLEVENTGTSTLTDVEVSTRNLRLNLDNLQTTQGSFDRIEANELTVAVLELPIEEGRLAGRVATRGLPIELEVTAVPVDFDGEDLDQVWGESVVWIEVDTDDALPGFGDSVSGGASGVVAVFSIILIVVGGVLPFLPIVVVLVAIVWWIRRRIQKKSALANRGQESGE